MMTYSHYLELLSESESLVDVLVLSEVLILVEALSEMLIEPLNDSLKLPESLRAFGG